MAPQCVAVSAGRTRPDRYITPWGERPTKDTRRPSTHPPVSKAPTREDIGIAQCVCPAAVTEHLS
jgi:hypothetical protein